MDQKGRHNQFLAAKYMGVTRIGCRVRDTKSRDCWWPWGLFMASCACNCYFTLKLPEYKQTRRRELHRDRSTHARSDRPTDRPTLKQAAADHAVRARRAKPEHREKGVQGGARGVVARAESTRG